MCMNVSIIHTYICIYIYIYMYVRIKLSFEGTGTASRPGLILNIAITQVEHL